MPNKPDSPQTGVLDFFRTGISGQIRLTVVPGDRPDFAGDTAVGAVCYPHMFFDGYGGCNGASRIAGGPEPCGFGPRKKSVT